MPGYQIPSNAFNLPSGAQSVYDPLVIPSSNFDISPATAPTASASGAGTTGGSMPALAIMAIMAAAQAAQQYAASRSANNAMKNQNEQSNIASGVREAEQNPFSHSMDQMGFLGGLDQSLHTTPGSITPGTGTGTVGRYASATPSQYTMSPEMMQWAAEMQRRVANGQGQNTPITPGYSSGVRALPPKV